MNTSLDRLNTICESIEPLVSGFVAADHELFLVGGVVRDVLLEGSEIQDIDLTTNARPDQIRQIISPISESIWDQGERFGTLGARIDGVDVEVTTFRSEKYSLDSRKPQVSFGDTIAGDLERRDFTINAMAYDCVKRVIVDPFDGAEDLVDRVLRTPADPNMSFSDDPLRVLRAGRFAARLNLEFDKSLIEAARGQADRISVVSAERINVELDKLLAASYLDVGFNFLSDARFFESYLEWLQESDVLEQFLKEAAETSEAKLRRVLLFRRSLEPKLEMDRLKYSRSETNFVTSVIGAVSELKDEENIEYAVRKIVHRRSPDVAQTAVECCVIDGNVEVSETYRQIVDSEGLQLELPVSGDDIMSRLGISSGPGVGEALDKVADLMYRSGPLTSQQAWDLLEN